MCARRVGRKRQDVYITVGRSAQGKPHMLIIPCLKTMENVAAARNCLKQGYENASVPLIISDF